jgi:ribosomal protein L3
MISKILYQNSLFNIINELPQDLFWEQQEKTLELLNYIAVALANKENFTVAVQILEVAQQFNFKSKKYDDLISKNLQIIISQRFAKDNKTTIPHNKHNNNTQSKDPTVIVINKHLKSLENILNKAKHQVIHWRMISKILYQNSLLATINELPQDLFVEQKDKVLSLLNAIAIIVSNKDNFTLAVQILEVAQKFNFKSKKYDALIAKNLQIVTKKCFAKNNKTTIPHNKNHNKSSKFKKYTFENKQANPKQNTKQYDPYSDYSSEGNGWFYTILIVAGLILLKICGV